MGGVAALTEQEFRIKSDEALELARHSLMALADQEGFEIEMQHGVLNLLFEEPSDARFVVSPNAPVRQIWISAMAKSYKLSWAPELGAFALDVIDMRKGDLDAGTLAMALELLEQRLFDVGGELQVAGRRHLGRVGEDRLRLGKIPDRVELLSRLEDDKTETRPLRFYGGGDTRYPGADDRDVEELGHAVL